MYAVITDQNNPRVIEFTLIDRGYYSATIKYDGDLLLENCHGFVKSVDDYLIDTFKVPIFDTRREAIDFHLNLITFEINRLTSDLSNATKLRDELEELL